MAAGNGLISGSQLRRRHRRRSSSSPRPAPASSSRRDGCGEWPDLEDEEIHDQRRHCHLWPPSPSSPATSSSPRPLLRPPIPPGVSYMFGSTILRVSELAEADFVGGVVVLPLHTTTSFSSVDRIKILF